MTAEQVAAYLQLNKLTVYRYIREGRIPAARLGKAYRVRKSDVDAFLESRMVRHPVQASAWDRKPATAAQVPVPRVPEAIYVAPRRREPTERHPEVTINPMDWVIRGLH